MIGTTIESQPRVSIGAIVWLSVAAIFVLSAAIFRNHYAAIFAVMPACIAIGCWFGKPRRFRAHITADGLILESPQRLLPYADIEMLHIQGGDLATKHARMHLYHSWGTTEVPASIDGSRAEFHDFIDEMIRRHRQPAVPAALASFASEQRATFGEDHVQVFGTRSKIGKIRSRRLAYSLTASLAACAMIWVFTGVAISEVGWIVAGAWMLFLLALFAAVLLGTSRKKPGIKNWRESGLIISPLAIALSQGDIKGQLRWKELRQVQMKRGSGTSQLTSGTLPHHIRLKIDGATIVIADIYDAPLTTIHEHILHHWRG